MAHILGEREFWSLKLQVNPSTLIPRADTETFGGMGAGAAVARLRARAGFGHRHRRYRLGFG